MPHESFLKPVCISQHQKHQLTCSESPQQKLEIQTLFVKGDVGISTSREQLLGKIPLLMSLIAACIKGKHTATASLKSPSLLSSFFLPWNGQKINTSYDQMLRTCNYMQKHKNIQYSIYQFSDIDKDGNPQIKASLAPATTPEWNLLESHFIKTMSPSNRQRRLLKTGKRQQQVFTASTGIIKR